MPCRKTPPFADYHGRQPMAVSPKPQPGLYFAFPLTVSTVTADGTRLAATLELAPNECVRLTFQVNGSAPVTHLLANYEANLLARALKQAARNARHEVGRTKAERQAARQFFFNPTPPTNPDDAHDFSDEDEGGHR